MFVHDDNLLSYSTFIRNRGDGALATEYSHTEFRGQNLFQENLGTSTEVSKVAIVYLTTWRSLMACLCHSVGICMV